MTAPLQYNLFGIPRLDIDEILKVTAYGNSCPLIVRASDNNQYVLKTRMDGTLEDKNDYGIFIEALSYLLLKSIGFDNIPSICILNINEETQEDVKFKFSSSSKEREQVALKNIFGSKGSNLGIGWIDKCEIMTTLPNENFISETVNFDAWLMNLDRDTKNPNILYCTDNLKHYLIDFGGAFEQLTAFYIIEGENAIFEIPKLYKKLCFDDRYLFREHISKCKKKKISKTNNEIIDLMRLLPSEWEPHNVSQEIADILSQRIGKKELICAG